MPVPFVAVAEKVAVVAPWQRVDVAPKAKTGVPTVGVTVTTWDTFVGPPQPVAIAVMVVVPPQPAAQVTAPVTALMVFPAAKLAASRL